MEKNKFEIIKSDKMFESRNNIIYVSKYSYSNFTGTYRIINDSSYGISLEKKYKWKRTGLV